MAEAAKARRASGGGSQPPSQPAGRPPLPPAPVEAAPNHARAVDVAVDSLESALRRLFKDAHENGELECTQEEADAHIAALRDPQHYPTGLITNKVRCGASGGSPGARGCHWAGCRVLSPALSALRPRRTCWTWPTTCARTRCGPS